MPESTKQLPIKLSDGTIIHIEVNNDAQLDQREDVSSHLYSFENVKSQIKSFSEDLYNSLDSLKPKTIKVEFGCEFSVEAGNVIALFTKGSAKANLKIILEWSTDK